MHVRVRKKKPKSVSNPSHVLFAPQINSLQVREKTQIFLKPFLCLLSFHAFTPQMNSMQLQVSEREKPKSVSKSNPSHVLFTTQMNIMQ